VVADSNGPITATAADLGSDVNPYESPASITVEKPAEELRRPPLGTFLIGLWLVEGGIKAFVVIAGIYNGVDPREVLPAEYSMRTSLVFSLIASFLIVETIGPWIGIYFLTGRRARTIPLEKALFQTLKMAGGIAVVAVLALMAYDQLIS
jgi:hypothetical protein